MASLVHLFRAPKRRLSREEVATADSVADLGFAGCAHAKKKSPRQVLLVDKETLDAMDLRPGMIRENITTEGINVNGLGLGEQLRIGPVLLQVSAVCTLCDQLKGTAGLRREIYGRRGMLCQVLQGGTIRAGDSIARVAAASSNHCDNLRGCGGSSCDGEGASGG
jgi:MOSC domain-containing protein YiiM